MRRIILGALVLSSIAAAPAYADVPVTLQGSPESMVRQNDIAKKRELPFVQTPKEVGELKGEGKLVRLEGNENYAVADFVSHPYGQPEMRTFIERLAAQYRAATGEKLVVTSLTRPASRQPSNSHKLSVHPTGIAVDLRISQRAESREWLESTLLALEEQGVLDATREKSPPHYHVALFPAAYMAHVERLMEQEAAREVLAVRETAAPQLRADVSTPVREESGEEISLTGLWVLLVTLPLAWFSAQRNRGNDSRPS